MKKSKNRNYIICSILTLALFLSLQVNGFASACKIAPLNNSSIIESVDDNSILVKENGKTKKITVSDENGIRTITILDTDTKKSDYIHYNQNTNIAYSSLTDETIDLNKDEELMSPSTFTGTPIRKSVSNYETKKISYAQIKKIVGNAATTASVIGAILCLVPGTESIGGAISAVSTIVSTLNSSTKASSKHGIKLKIKITKYYRTRAGRRQVYKTTKSIVSGSTY